MSLKEYQRKRDFTKTKEPRSGKLSHSHPMFVVQKHWASHLHYDFRLEAFGVLKSWAVPKGPSLDPDVKRLAVEVEDHPVSYGNFEGHIPEGEYGGGDVIVWDHGTWDPPEELKAKLAKGHIDFELHGEKLKGQWVLQRIRQAGSGKNQWLLIKKTDSESKPQDEYNVVEEEPDSVMPNKSLGKVKKKARANRLVAKNVNKTAKDLTNTTLEPKLALLVEQAPVGPQWIYEIKYDGYRTFALLNDKNVSLRTRHNLDWTTKYGPIAADVAKLKTTQAVLDGEIVVLDKKGRSSFQDLQTALKNKDYNRMVYYVFDLLVLDGKDLREQSLEQRKKLLKGLLAKSKTKTILLTKHWKNQGSQLFAASCAADLEGIVAKDKTAPYVGGRGPDWMKIKCSRRQEFVIGGYTDPQGARSGFGSLLMGVFEQGKLRYCGRVGTGFNQQTLSSTLKALKSLDTDDSPFDIHSPHESDIHWVKPKLVAEIEFKTFTGDGLIRQGSFQGLRQDKSGEEVQLEVPKKLTKKLIKTAKRSVVEAKSHPQANTTDGKAVVEGVNITHPDRVVFTQQDITKLQIAEYYKSVEKWLMPHLQKHPVSLLRCTGTDHASCFFQKHMETNALPGVKEISFNYKDKEEAVLTVETTKGLIELVQWGTLEFHVWGCTAPQILQPNLIVFDLDPHEDVPWKKTRATAFAIRDNLKKLGLVSYVKVTGGKGLHIHVPCKPNYTWDEIKNFAKTFVDEFEQRNPDLYITKAIKKERKGKIFLDYLRNGFGATSVVPYSVRARDQATIALPISWDELKTLKRPDSFLLTNVPVLLKKRKKDPWEGYFKNHQKIKILEQAR